MSSRPASCCFFFVKARAELGAALFLSLVILVAPGAWCLFLPGTLSAEEGPRNEATDFAPPEVLVVTGEPAAETSLTSPDVQTARENLRTLPGAVGIQDTADFQRGRGAYLEDFLRYRPGILVQSGQGTEDNKVSVRGSGVQNDDLSGLSILVDGIPLNQADGEAYLYDVDLHSVKYAELYRGADALRYGGVTLGGAINLVTVTGREADPLTARFAFGSFGLYEQQLTSGWSADRWDVYGSAANHVLGGYRDHSQENFQKAFLSLGVRVSEVAENRTYFFFDRLDQNNPSGLTKDELETNPRQTSPESTAQRWSTRWTYVRLADRFVVRQGDDARWLLALAWNHRQATRREEYEDDFRLGATRYYSDDFGANVAFETKADFLHGKNRFSAGVVPTFERESDSFYANPDGRLGELLFTDRTYYLNLPLYLENQHYLTRRFSLLTGFQAVYVHRVFQDNTRSSAFGDQSHDDDFWAFNPKVGLAYEWNDRSLVYVNASRSFQPPSFDESLGVREGPEGGRVFNGLNAQRAITLELGTRGEAGPIQWDLALYRSWVRDELLDQNNDQGQPLGTINVPRTVHQGIEAGLETELGRALFVKSGSPRTKPSSKDGKDGADAKSRRADDSRENADRLVLDQTYTLSDFHFDDDPVYDNHRVAGTPVHFYKAELRYEHPRGFYVGANVEWNVTKYPVDEANSLFADPYALLGLRAGYKTNKGLQMFFEAKNLTDKVYAATVDPLGDARTGDDVASFNPGNGRAFYGGVSWVW